MNVAVHSKRLGANAAVGTTDTTLYTCPSGSRTIVKGVQWQNLGATAAQARLKVFNGATQVMQYSTQLGALHAADDSDTREIWLVMNAGETLKVAMSAGTAMVAVSGAELTL